MVTCYTCLEKLKRVWPNPLKAMAAALLMLFGMAIAAIGAWNYMYYETQIRGFTVGGHAYLPEFVLDFKSFSDRLFYCICGSGAMLLLA